MCVGASPSLAQVNGNRLEAIIAAVWLIGGGLAAAAGVLYGLTNQITPLMGNDLLLPAFAATLAGGI